MVSISLIAALALSFPTIRALCPSLHMPKDIIERAVEYETIQLNSLTPRSNLKIGVYLHNVASGPTWDEGYVSEPLLKQQFKILHDSFLPYGFELSLGNISHTINPVWANSTVFSKSEADMKNALHQGVYTDVNIYIVDRLFYPDRINDTEAHIDPGNDLGLELYEVGGFSRFPLSGLVWFSDFVSDAILLSHKVAWGSNSTNRGLGLTAVHEMGHWLGLEHTFLFGCKGLGDEISDTPNEDINVPLEGNATVATCLPRDTCPDQPGMDPIHNHMGYTSDICRSEFTPKQVDRMHTLFRLLRAAKVPS